MTQILDINITKAMQVIKTWIRILRSEHTRTQFLDPNVPDPICMDLDLDQNFFGIQKQVTYISTLFRIKDCGCLDNHIHVCNLISRSPSSRPKNQSLLNLRIDRCLALGQQWIRQNLQQPSAFLIFLKTMVYIQIFTPTTYKVIKVSVSHLDQQPKAKGKEQETF